MFGERLHLARKKAGYSLRDLADRLEGKISAQAIGKYERGEMMPSSGILIGLAKALGVSMDFFAAPSGVRLGNIDFRKHSGTSVRERAQVEAEVIEHVERYILIEEILDLQSSEWQEPFHRRLVSTPEGAEKVAEDVRNLWRLGEDPIPNLTELLEEKGVKVMLLDLPDRVSGLTCEVQRPGKEPVPVVVVNKNHNLERRRLTMAHELGHRVMEASEDILEKAANRFAGALLQPPQHVLQEVGHSRHRFGVEEVVATKRLYRVSAAAFVVRCRDLGIISNDYLIRIFQTIGRTWRSNEPKPLEMPDQRGEFEKPKRFQRLCYRALAEDLINQTKAAELLQIPVRQIEAAMVGLINGPDRHQ
ncbi:XRE family transcriptional regulator [Magnetospirillum sp. 15-1]|uniref:helix-turn-helix domain-containing protein n=1 Tax=Magnetospirillum sp. 15-1 TaxID=1979370 RepID=UPI000BBC4993|nr:XRE family transcriptional regulator [Magnetospirillum sp. 15-1]